MVVSGEPEALDEFIDAMKADDIQARRISVDYASHSHQVARVRDKVIGALDGVAPVTAPVPLYSTLHGTRLDTAELDRDYWYDNLRERVLFDSAVRRSTEDGFRLFIEMSPHPVLTVPVQEIVEDLDDALVLSSTRRDRGEVAALLGSLAHLHARGGPVDWSALIGAAAGWICDLRLPAATLLGGLRTPRGRTGAAVDGAAAGRRAAGAPVRPDLRPAGGGRDGTRPRARPRQGRRRAGPQLRTSINPDQQFKEIGFDSLLSMELSKRLTTSTGVKLRANLVLRHPSPRMVAGHIVSTLAAGDRSKAKKGLSGLRRRCIVPPAGRGG